MIELTSVSHAEDSGYQAIKDIALITRQAGIDYRLIGGHMVTMLAAYQGVTDPPARETADADLGASLSAISDPALPKTLRQHGYSQPGASNRFVRDLGSGREAVIDILGPSYTSAHKPNQHHGELYIDAIPGLSWALSAAPTLIRFTATLTVGEKVAAEVLVPGPLPALCLKLHAYRARREAKDVRDIWRLLAVCHQAGIGPGDWSNSTATTARQILNQLAALGSKPLSYHFSERRLRAEFRALAQAVAG
ncbi:MAG: hypothetical protein LBH68_08195 [Bifidobacteriaceae bacterium]|jgi:hypothetical protein|nr:hypothetical protein [Bifidobacteriaceae bacterium]